MCKKVNSKERKGLIAVLRNKGNFLANSGNKCTKPVRRPTGHNIVSNDYLPCEFCYGYFLRKQLWRHRKKCPMNSDNRALTQASAQNFLLKHLRIDEQLKTKVFPHMRGDRISFIAKKDLLICAFGARYLKTHRDKHFIHVTSRKMRELSKLLIQLQKINCDIKNLFKALRPQYYDTVVQAVKTVAKYNEEDNSFSAPTYAMNICKSLKDCCDIAINFALKKKDVYGKISSAEAESDLKTFIHLLNSNWNYDVSNEASSCLNMRKWNKITIIPLASDLKVFKDYLTAKSNKAARKLNSVNDDKIAYKELLETIFCRVIVLNRKRPGELERIYVKTYQNADSHQNYEEFADVVSVTEKILMKKFKRVVIRGKRGRGVPVLFSSEVQQHVDILLKVRPQIFANVFNPYLFGRPSYTTPISGYKTLEKHAKLSGVQNPSALTATRLRKHLATITQIFNMSEGDIEQLATFMGHTERVHRSEYRLPDDVYQTAKICKLLLMMESGTAAQWKGMRLEDININMEDDLLSTDARHEDIFDICEDSAPDTPDAQDNTTQHNPYITQDNTTHNSSIPKTKKRGF